VFFVCLALHSLRAARRASVTSDITIEGRTEIHLPGSTGCSTPLRQHKEQNEDSPLPPDPGDTPAADTPDSPGVKDLETMGRTSSYNAALVVGAEATASEGQRGTEQDTDAADTQAVPLEEAEMGTAEPVPGTNDTDAVQETKLN